MIQQQKYLLLDCSPPQRLHQQGNQQLLHPASITTSTMNQPQPLSRVTNPCMVQQQSYSLPDHNAPQNVPPVEQPTATSPRRSEHRSDIRQHSCRRLRHMLPKHELQCALCGGCVFHNQHSVPAAVAEDCQQQQRQATGLGQVLLPFTTGQAGRVQNARAKRHTTLPPAQHQTQRRMTQVLATSAGKACLKTMLNTGDAGRKQSTVLALLARSSSPWMTRSNSCWHVHHSHVCSTAPTKRLSSRARKHFSISSDPLQTWAGSTRFAASGRCCRDAAFACLLGPVSTPRSAPLSFLRTPAGASTSLADDPIISIPGLQSELALSFPPCMRRVKWRSSMIAKPATITIAPKTKLRVLMPLRRCNKMPVRYGPRNPPSIQMEL